MIRTKTFSEIVKTSTFLLRGSAKTSVFACFSAVSGVFGRACKQGQHSGSVQRQSCGALGKKANCQAAVSVHYVSPTGHYPLVLRLYLPVSWTSDHARLRAAQVRRCAFGLPHQGTIMKVASGWAFTTTPVWSCWPTAS
jgi:hypothetical protein